MRGCSSIVRATTPLGRSPAIELHVAPPSPERKTYGVRSSSLWPSNTTYATRASTRDGSTFPTHRGAGRRNRLVMFVQRAPASVVICTWPSSVPTYTVPGAFGVVPIVVIVP